MCVCGYSTKSLKKMVDFQQHLRGVEEFCDWEASSSFNLSQKLLEMDGSLGAPKGQWDDEAVGRIMGLCGREPEAKAPQKNGDLTIGWNL